MIEFIAMTLILLIPLLYLVVTLGRVQAAAYAAESAAQGAARGAVVAGVARLDEGASEAEALASAQSRADAVVALAVADFGFARDQSELALSCGGDSCLAPGSDMEAAVSVRVSLPGVPGFLADAGLAVTLTGRASSPVDDFGGDG